MCGYFRFLYFSLGTFYNFTDVMDKIFDQGYFINCLLEDETVDFVYSFGVCDEKTLSLLKLSDLTDLTESFKDLSFCKV